MTTTVTTLPVPTELILGQDNDKVLSVTPKRDGVAIDRTNKRLRFVLKKTEETADASATIDIDSVGAPADVFGVGAASTGQWSIDLSDLLPVPGRYWFRVDIAASSSNNTDRECVARGPFVIEKV